VQLGQLRSIFLIILRALNPSTPIAFLQGILLGLVSPGALLAPLRKGRGGDPGPSTPLSGGGARWALHESTVQYYPGSLCSYAWWRGVRCDSFHRIVFSPTMLKDHRTNNILHALGQIQEQHHQILVA